ncbi:hypothetical protein [Catenuloplanes japonicus]|uniref:hypothetical protein n=1 Tax=Catenuloplanes japonicus TaxID=33876 RepID=UPI000ABA4454|nr:hypothetical protein [Catenuloplanes japonicus]
MRTFRSTYAVAAALLAAAVVAVATDRLPVFGAEEMVPVAVSREDLFALPDLSAYGEVQVVEEPHVREVAGGEVNGLALPVVDALPRGVTGEPIFHAGDRATLLFTLDAPDDAALDGSRFRLTAGPGVAAVWAEDRGVPALFVGRAVAPAAHAESGADFVVARDYLVSRAGVPEGMLRQFAGDGTTLPSPIGGGRLTSTPADVNGASATLLTSRDGVLAAVVWVRDGLVTVVAGSLTADEVLTVARQLR